MNFSDLIKNKQSQFTQLSEVEISENDIEEVQSYLITSIGIIGQAHIFHLFTKNGFLHEALEEFYKIIQDEIDEITEMLLAHYDLSNSGDSYDFQFDFDINYLEETIEEYRDYTTEMIELFSDEEGEFENQSVIGELTEIQEACDKLLYKARMR